jgi:hypothetical protein
MRCWRDQSYCNEVCANMSCHRNVQHAYNELAHVPDGYRLPVSISPMKDTRHCMGYSSLIDDLTERLGMTDG